MNHQVILEFRRSGNFDAALELAHSEWEKDPKTIWNRRNLGWVYFEILKKYNSPSNFEVFVKYLEFVGLLSLPPEERIFHEHICWQVVKMAFSLSESGEATSKAPMLFESIRGLHMPKPSSAYSKLFISMHKCLKHTGAYIPFADWWDFANFRKEDYEKRTLQSDRELLSIAEQSHLDYSRRLLYASPRQGDFVLDVEKAAQFLTRMEELSKKHPEYKYIPHQISKLYLALGNKEQAVKNTTSHLRKNRNNFFGWAFLADCLKDNRELDLALLCRALSIPYQETAKRKYRLMLAEVLIEQRHYDEARTEIDMVIRNLQSDGKAISNALKGHLQSQWYSDSRDLGSNEILYMNHLFQAEDFLDGTPKKTPVLVEFVNSRSKILYFIAGGEIAGQFKYERLISKVSLGEKLMVRFRGKARKGVNQALSVEKSDDEKILSEYVQPVAGTLEVSTLTGAGRIGDVQVGRNLVRSSHLSSGMRVEGIAIRSYNSKTNGFGWKAIHLEKQFFK